jgi:hypothetical protein
MNVEKSHFGRRRFLGRMVLLAGSGLLTRCGSCQGKGTSKPAAGGQVFKSTVEDLPAKLERLRLISEKAGQPLDEHLQPGLSRQEIDARTRELPFRLPEELYTLYRWRNGSKPGSRLFLFRDHFFSSLENGMADLEGLAAHGVRNAFPFAAFEGSYYALPSEPHAFGPRYERPVVNAFEGVDVYFFSLSRMLDTAIDWIEQGVHKAPGTPTDRQKELAIWRQHNPGVFESQ